jgi:hypothetical protein
MDVSDAKICTAVTFLAHPATLVGQAHLMSDMLSCIPSMKFRLDGETV